MSSDVLSFSKKRKLEECKDNVVDFQNNQPNRVASPTQPYVLGENSNSTEKQFEEISQENSNDSQITLKNSSSQETTVNENLSNPVKFQDIDRQTEDTKWYVSTHKFPDNYISALKKKIHKLEVENKLLIDLIKSKLSS